jgi:hypothetical protein
MADSYDDFLAEQTSSDPDDVPGTGGPATAVAPAVETTDDDSYEEFKRQQRQAKLAADRAAARKPQAPAPTTGPSPAPQTPSGALNLGAVGLTPYQPDPAAVAPPTRQGVLDIGNRMTLAARDATATPSTPADHPSPFATGEGLDARLAREAHEASVSGMAGQFVQDQATAALGLIAHPVSGTEALAKAAVTAPARILQGIGEAGEKVASLVPLTTGAQARTDAGDVPSWSEAASTAAGGLMDTALLTAPLGEAASGFVGDVAAGAQAGARNVALDQAAADMAAARAKRMAAKAAPADVASDATGSVTPTGSQEPLALPPGQYEMPGETVQGNLAALGQTKADADAAARVRAHAQALGEPRALLAPSAEEQAGAAQAADFVGSPLDANASPDDVAAYARMRDAGVGVPGREIGSPRPLPGESPSAFADRVINRQGTLDAATERSAIQDEGASPAETEAAARVNGQFSTATTKGGTLRSVDQFPKLTDDALLSHMADLVDNKLGAFKGAQQKNYAARLDAAEAELESRGMRTDDIWSTGLEKGRDLNAARNATAAPASDALTPRTGGATIAPLAAVAGAGAGALADKDHPLEGAALGAVSALGLVAVESKIARDGELAASAAQAEDEARARPPMPRAAGPSAVDIAQGRFASMAERSADAETFPPPKVPGATVGTVRGPNVIDIAERRVTPATAANADALRDAERVKGYGRRAGDTTGAPAVGSEAEAQPEAEAAPKAKPPVDPAPAAPPRAQALTPRSGQAAVDAMRETGFAAPKPAEAVDVPVAGAGRGGSTVNAMHAARDALGDDEFRRQVNAEIAKRGGATSPEVTMAAAEEVARRTASASARSKVADTTAALKTALRDAGTHDAVAQRILDDVGKNDARAVEFRRGVIAPGSEAAKALEDAHAAQVTADQLSSATPPRTGAVSPRVVKTLAGAAVGGVAGSFVGDTPEQRKRNAVLGLAGGALAGAGLSGEAKALEPGEKAELGAAATMERPSASAKDITDSITSTFAPHTRGDLAAATGEIVRGRRGQMDRELSIAQHSLDDAVTSTAPLSIGKKLGMQDDIEQGRAQRDPANTPLAKGIRRTLDRERDAIQALGTGKLAHFIENYFPHLWQDPDAAGSWLSKIMGKRPMEGSKSFLKQRTIPTVLEGMFPEGVPKTLDTMSNAEILAENKRQGGLVPVTFNPVEATMLKLREMKKYRMAQQVMGDLTDRGLLVPVKEGGKMPAGYARIGDWAFAGKAAPEPVARVLNNYLSPGLRGKSAALDAYMAVGNTLNQAQLGLSAYHAGMDGLNAIVSQNARALEKLFGGKAGEAVKLFATSPGAVVSTMRKGSELLKAYSAAPGTLTGPIKAIADGMADAGGRPRMAGFHDASTAFANALEAKQYGRVAQKLLPAMVEKTTGIVMNQIVPRLKLGVFYDLASDALDKLGPAAHPDDVRRAMQRAWDSVDNRMGSVVYDNLFWNKAMKDVMHATVRSVGWNWGTLGELGGGAKDLAGFAKDVVTGKGGELSHRAAYTMALPMTIGLAGAVMQYLYTGKGPSDLFDMFHPKTGTKDADGNDNRVVLPSYMKDVYSYGQHPVKTITNKMNPLLSSLADMLSNKNYYGDEIYNAEDPVMKRLAQTATFAAKEAVPFMIQNVVEGKQRGEKPSEMAAAFVGVTPASREAVRTKAQNAMADLAARKHIERTPEEADAAQIRSTLRDKVKTEGAPAALAELRAHLRDGTLTMKQVQGILRDDQTPYLVKQFKSLPLAEAERIYAMGTAREKALWGPVLAGKRQRAQ